MNPLKLQKRNSNGDLLEEINSVSSAEESVKLYDDDEDTNPSPPNALGGCFTSATKDAA